MSTDYVMILDISGDRLIKIGPILVFKRPCFGNNSRLLLHHQRENAFVVINNVLRLIVVLWTNHLLHLQRVNDLFSLLL